MRKYGLKAMALIAAFSLSCPVITLAAWEQQTDGSWKYYDRNGNLGVNKWAKSGDYWYHLNGNGDIDYNMLIEDQGQTYYVDAEGRMATNQWINHNSVYYYAGTDGAFLKSCITPDGYTVDANGVWNQTIPQQSSESIATPIQIPQATGFGSVTGNITWQYNKFIGTKADVGAKVYLIPLDYTIRGGGNEDLALCMDTNGKNNVFYTKVDGMGQYNFTNIPSGNYLLFVKSKNTTSSLRFNNESSWEERIEARFNSILTNDELEKFKTMVGYDSYFTDVIEVKDNQNTVSSHDFGYTYI